ncbi:hypothetical protein ACWGDT_44305 [Streptomyces avermitilis]
MSARTVRTYLGSLASPGPARETVDTLLLTSSDPVANASHVFAGP